MEELLQRLHLDRLLDRTLAAAPLVILVAVVGLLVIRFVRGAVSRVGRRIAERQEPERRQRIITLTRTGNALLSAVLGVGLLMYALDAVGLNVAPLLAGAGVAGLAIGFGAQNLIRDFFGGFFILAEEQYNLGDVIKVAGVSGVVEEMTLRVTKLRDFDGSLHVIPNGRIELVTNMTSGFSCSVLNVKVSGDENVERVMAALRETGETMRQDPAWAQKFLEPLEVFGVDSLDDHTISIGTRLKTPAGEQWSAARELRRRIKLAFDERGIEIPYPHLRVDQEEKKRS